MHKKQYWYKIKTSSARTAGHNEALSPCVELISVSSGASTEAQGLRVLCFPVPIAGDKTMHHVPVAVDKRDTATLTSPAVQAFHRHCKNQQNNRQSATGPRYGRWTIEYGRYASSRPFCNNQLGWLSESTNLTGRDSRACPIVQRKSQ